MRSFLVPNFSLLAHPVPELWRVKKCQKWLKVRINYIYAVGKRAHFGGKEFGGWDGATFALASAVMYVYKVSVWDPPRRF